VKPNVRVEWGVSVMTNNPFKDFVDNLVNALEEQATNSKATPKAECLHSSTIIHNEQGETTCLECGELNV
jgi:hypothetical protein